MIIPTALGCVAAIFASILQYQNGGLLNVFMKPVPPTGGQNGTSFDIQSDFSGIYTQVMNIVWGKLTEADLAVLAALPPDLGGGEEGVKVAIVNPNREGQILVTFIVCLVFASLGLLAIFVFSLICCYSCGDQHCKDKEEKDEVISESPNKAQKFLILHQNVICCGLHLFAFIMTALLLIGLAVCIGYFFGAANLLSETMANSQADDAAVVGWLRGNSPSFSIGRILQFFVSNVATFGYSSIDSAKANITATVVTVRNTLLEKTLPKEVSTLVAALMTQFKMAEIEDVVNDMAYAIANAAKHSDFISMNYNSTIRTFVTTSEKLKLILTSNVGQCNVPTSEANALKSGFNHRNVLPVPQQVTVLLTESNQKLQHLKSTFDYVTRQVQGMQEQVMRALKRELNLDQILDGMGNLMRSLEEQLNDVIEKMDNMSQRVSGYLREYSGYVNAGLYTLSLPCILAGIAFIGLLAFFLFEALQRHLFSIRGTSVSQGSGAWKPRPHVRGGIFCVSSALLLVPIILIGLAAVVTATVGGFLHSEVCPYVASSSGIRMTDYVANSKIAVIWDNLIPSGGGRTGGNDFAGILNLKAPQNPLHAVEIGCDPQNVGRISKSGLLVQMGIDNLVNTTALLESNIVAEHIYNLKMAFVNNIADAHLGNAVPHDTLAKLKLIREFQKKVKLLNLPQSIEHLGQHVFKTEEIKAFANKLPSNCSVQRELLIALVPHLKDNNAASIKIRSAYDGLNRNIVALNSSKLETVLASFKALTASRNLVGQALALPLHKLTSALLASVNEIGNEAFANLTQNLLPCGSLHYAVQSVVFMACGPSGLAPRVFAWGLFLSLCLFFTFFSLLSLCLLWRVQNHQAKRFANFGYLDDDESWSED